MKYERISTNQVNINSVSTMSRINDLCKNLHADSWEFYNFLVSGYPELEQNNPSCFKKAHEGENVDITESFGWSYIGELYEHPLSFSAKTNSKRYNIRDKARHGHKGKKVNDTCGEKWVKANITSKKHSKAIKKMVEEDMTAYHNGYWTESEVTYMAYLLYHDVLLPMTKSKKQVVAEVLDEFSSMMDLNNNFLNIIEGVVGGLYNEEKEKLNYYLNELIQAKYWLEELERKKEATTDSIFYYKDIINRMGINPDTYNSF